jgi:hypothetical protein
MFPVFLRLLFLILKMFLPLLMTSSKQFDVSGQWSPTARTKSLVLLTKDALGFLCLCQSILILLTERHFPYMERSSCCPCIYRENSTLLGARGAEVGIATNYRVDSQGVSVWVPVGVTFFSSPCPPEQFWGPFNGYYGVFPRTWSLPLNWH